MQRSRGERSRHEWPEWSVLLRNCGTPSQWRHSGQNTHCPSASYAASSRFPGKERSSLQQPCPPRDAGTGTLHCLCTSWDTTRGRGLKHTAWSWHLLTNDAKSSTISLQGGWEAMASLTAGKAKSTPRTQDHAHSLYNLETSLEVIPVVFFMRQIPQLLNRNKL